VILLTPPHVYADESNSTGENLLDPSQPVFAMGMVHIEDDLASSLVADVLQQLSEGHGEPKYTALAKTRTGRAALLDCFRRLPDGSARAYLAHKRFMAEAKMIDLLIEPMAHEDGYNMYADGAAVGLANLLHFLGPVVGDEEAYTRMLSTFVRAMRSNSTANLDELFESVDAYCESIEPELRSPIELLKYTRREAEYLVDGINRGAFRDDLDPAIPCLYILVDDFGQRIGPFILVHDRSNVVARHALQLLKTHELPNPTREGKLLRPLPAVSIELADSKSAPQLQLADWVAGATRQWGTQVATQKADRFAFELEPLVRGWAIGGLWPDQDVITSPSPRIIE
jgi:hypothetical protein